MRVYIHNIGNSQGSNLLTAQGNTEDIDECIFLSSSELSEVWIGLQRDPFGNWDWTSDDAPAYVESEVNWRNNNPRNGRRSSDCAILITVGNNQRKITNSASVNCNFERQYCCNSVSSENTPQPTISTTAPVTPGCPRIRKEWNTATQTERDLYITGMIKLANAGRLSLFTQQHGELLAEDQAHGTSAFLPWHRYVYTSN